MAPRVSVYYERHALMGPTKTAHFFQWAPMILIHKMLEIWPFVNHSNFTKIFPLLGRGEMSADTADVGISDSDWQSRFLPTWRDVGSGVQLSFA